MDRTWLRFIPAFALFYVLSTLANFYIFDRITGLLGVENQWVSAIYAFSLSTLLAVGFAVRMSSRRSTRGLFIAITTVYGLEFAALFGLVIFEVADLALGLDNRRSGIALVAFIAAIATISAINAQFVSVKRIELPFARKLRIVQLSDLHIGAVHRERYLKNVVDQVNSLKPDLVLITGDVVSGAADPGNSLEYLGKLEARAFLAPGNHEFYEGFSEMRAVLPGNIEILRDEEVQMDGYKVFGLDYTQGPGMPRARKLDRKFNGPIIAMAHEPQFLDLPVGSIILSGHYHAGQIFPINFIARIFVKYLSGIHRKGGIILYVSPGTATWGPPMRFGSRNEITLLELDPDN